MRENIGITGAEGTIGTILRNGLKNKYEIYPFTLEKQYFESRYGNLSDQKKVNGLFDGIDVLIHLAADPRPTAPDDSIWKNNYIATWNVFQECSRAKVKKIVFASSNHVQHGYTMKTTPETLDTSKNIKMKLTDGPYPDSLYAYSKLFGEQLGKFYADNNCFKFVALRIGWVIPENNPTVKIGTPAEDYMRAMFLSHRDCVEAFRIAVKLDRPFAISYAISRNGRRVFDLDETENICGFRPVDDAETFF